MAKSLHFFLPRAWCATLLLLAGIALPAWSAPASAEGVTVQYGLRFIGLPIGTASLKLQTEGSRYTVEGKGKVGGLMSLISDGKGTANVHGAVLPGRLAPAAFSEDRIEDGQHERTSFDLDGTTATNVKVDPMPKFKADRVPMTDANRLGVIDPLTALVVPGKGTDACNRTQPVFYATERFDMVLSYDHTETVRGGSRGYNGPAVVCAVRYRPIAGHRPNKRTTKFMIATKDIAIWLAPVPGTDLNVPVRIHVATMSGPVNVVATGFIPETPE
ncbi:Protein of unknown function [Faunimonas pinastri]|uniref:DUF3108 domain-containing protein n=1 Tax=Faunimonas pinastri TaxID=1855383 RepID=A0A1H9C8F0_9HYPH|nr:DUF3108 domain-containing protein [Faunimonas pinastri]SEP97466.1 Protein of unknown function [Faunimonas pinastri]